MDREPGAELTSRHPLFALRQLLNLTLNCRRSKAIYRLGRVDAHPVGRDDLGLGDAYLEQIFLLADLHEVEVGLFEDLASVGQQFAKLAVNGVEAVAAVLLAVQNGEWLSLNALRQTNSPAPPPSVP